PLAFSGANILSIADIDAGTGTVEVTLTATGGTVTLRGTARLAFVTGDGTSDAVMSFQGTIADINLALADLTFTGNANVNGMAGLTITTNDLGNTGAGGPRIDTDTIPITINPVDDAPVNSLPATQATGEGSVLVFSAANGNPIAISDVDAGTSPVRVTLGAIHGTLSLGGVAGLSFSTGDGTADSTMTFTGTIAAINAALNGLSFHPTPGYAGTAGLTILTDDQGFTGAGGPLQDSDTLDISVDPVNDPPVNAALGTQAFDEDTVLVFSGSHHNAIVISDPDADPGPIEVTLSAADGTLTLGSTSRLTFLRGDGTADPVMTFRGTLADVNTALDGLSLTPPPDFNGPSYLVASTNDLGNTGTGGPAFSIDYILLTINAVDDAPINTVPGIQATAEDTALVFSAGTGNAISIADVDAGTAEVEVHLVVTNGTLTFAWIAGLSFTSGDGTGDAGMIFRGTIAAINAALDGLRFQPTPDFNGMATLTITTDDLGNTGAGGPLSDTDSVTITVSPVNDAPAAVDDSLSVAQDSSNNVLPVLVNDSSAPDGEETLTVTAVGTAGHGTSALSSGQVIYTPVPGFVGVDSFTYTISDGNG
ncbi:MAG TPA: Ig-like domain-containing protein, partial [Isosphaeraceae bacterium]